MQPSSSSGRKVRLALMPVSFLVAFVVTMGALKVAAMIRGSNIAELLGTETLWPLVIIFPAFFLGKVLGLIVTNGLAYMTPLRRVFDRECAVAGRDGFAAATRGLARVALGCFALTAVATWVFVTFGP